MKTYNQRIFSHNDGLSIIELMVAIMLVSAMFVLMPYGTGESLEAVVDKTADDLDRAVRFASNESILRNAVVRLKIEMTETPNKYSVEYGPNGELTNFEKIDLAKMNFKEREAWQKKTDSFNRQFTPVSEFEDQAKSIDERIVIAGVASPQSDKVLRAETAYIYFYPTGERDGALIFISSSASLGVLTIPAFEDQTYYEKLNFTEYELANLDDSLENRMTEVFTKWRRND